MKKVLISAVVLSVFAGACAAQDSKAPSDDNKQLKKLFQKYPKADANKDGILTAGEAMAFYKNPKGGKSPDNGVKPTYENISYAPYPECVMNIWLVESDTPTPMIVNVHGGGFIAGDKKGRIDQAMFEKLEQAKVSFASIQYRFQSKDLPLSNVLRDIARSVQFLRYKAKDYNIDPGRIGLTGSSAGGNAVAWIGFHDDLADPANTDPVLRETTRVQAV